MDTGFVLVFASANSANRKRYLMIKKILKTMKYSKKTILLVLTQCGLVGRRRRRVCRRECASNCEKMGFYGTHIYDRAEAVIDELNSASYS